MMPFPNEEATPPVIKMYLVCIFQKKNAKIRKIENFGQIKIIPIEKKKNPENYGSGAISDDSDKRSNWVLGWME